MKQPQELNFVYLDDNELLRETAIETWQEIFKQKNISCNFSGVSSFNDAKAKLLELKKEKKHYAFITDVQIGDKDYIGEIEQLMNELPEMHIIIISGAQVKKELYEKGLFIYEKSTEVFTEKVLEAFDSIISKPFRLREEQKVHIDLDAYLNTALHILPAQEKELLKNLKQKGLLTEDIITKARLGSSLKEYLPASKQLLFAIKEAARHGEASKKELNILYKYYEVACYKEGIMPSYGKFLYFKPPNKTLKNKPKMLTKRIK